jgi:predicted nuclease of predicted toxin-antitoxin system
MKLLFDQNLSSRLSALLSDLYAGSIHVRDIGLTSATDTAIWLHAKQHGFVIVSKDSDFQQRSLLTGHPPNSYGFELEIVLCRPSITFSASIPRLSTHSTRM